VSAEFSIVTTAIDDEAKALEIARAVVEAGLAACTHITPIRSVYRWKGRIEEAQEFRLDMKMRSADYAALEAAILRLHSYETPQIIRIDIAGGHAAYLAWLAAKA